MSIALIADAGFTASSTGAPSYGATIYFAVGTANFNVGTVSVPLVGSDTAASLPGKFLAAIDAEAARMNLAAPTAVYGQTVAKLR